MPYTVPGPDYGTSRGESEPGGEAILVFLRWPEAGRAKTRLIPALGPEGAAGFYRRMAEGVIETVRRLERPGLRRVAFFAPADREREVAAWVGDRFQPLAQPETDLGGRLREGFERMFAEGAARVLAIGTDCPEVTTAHLAESLDALFAHDAVLGPAEDGGYWLLGLSRPTPAAFQGIPWSTKETGSRTLAALRAAGRTVALLPTLRDVDRPEDLPTTEVTK